MATLSKCLKLLQRRGHTHMRFTDGKRTRTVGIAPCRLHLERNPALDADDWFHVRRETIVVGRSGAPFGVVVPTPVIGPSVWELVRRPWPPEEDSPTISLPTNGTPTTPAWGWARHHASGAAEWLSPELEREVA